VLTYGNLSDTMLDSWDRDQIAERFSPSFLSAIVQGIKMKSHRSRRIAATKAEIAWIGIPYEILLSKSLEIKDDRVGD